MVESNLPKRRLKVAIGVLAAFLVVSTVGFYILGAPRRTWLQALYLSANILSTVGNWTEPLSDADEAWAILMMGFGIGGVTYAVGTLMALLAGGDIQRMLGRNQVTSQIQALTGHYIVCGFGRMGRAICHALAQSAVPFVLIDRETSRTAAAGALGYLYLLGDASDEAVLKKASIDNARGLVTSLPHDADNVYVTLTARGLCANLTIIARAEVDTAEQRLLRAGATKVVSPSGMGATKITRMLLHPALDDLIESMTSEGLAIDRLEVARLRDATGKSLRDLAFPRVYSVTVLAVERPGAPRVFNPAAEHVLAHSEQLIVVGLRQSLDRLMKDFGC